MKKVLTVLAVLVIALGCVFAAEETHNIRLKTQVGLTVPAFQLQFKNGTNVKDGAASNTNNSEATFSAGDKTQSAADITVLDISKYDISVTFNAVLMNAAKINEEYTLAFSATGFAVTRDGEDGEVEVATESTTATGDKTGVSTEKVAGVEKVTATFNGTTCSVNTVLATYTVTYDADPTVDPHTANDQYYYATITMTVSAS